MCRSVSSCSRDFVKLQKIKNHHPGHPATALSNRTNRTVTTLTLLNKKKKKKKEVKPGRFNCIYPPVGCKRCHRDRYESAEPSAQGKMFLSGNIGDSRADALSIAVSGCMYVVYQTAVAPTPTPPPPPPAHPAPPPSSASVFMSKLTPRTQI